MTPKQIYYENAAATIIKGLEKRQMEGYYCPDRTSAVAKALELMPEGSSIAWGGSMSLHESGLMEAVCHGPYKIIDRESAKTPEEQRQLYGKIACCDYFLMSTNAITMDGELVNIDGRGNRVAFLCYGPQNVIILAGMNKVVTDVDAGLKRGAQYRNGRPTPSACTKKRPVRSQDAVETASPRTASAASSLSPGAPAFRDASR